MTTLIEIASKYAADADALMDTSLPDDVVADTLVGMAGELEEKASNVAAVILSLDGFADQIHHREKQLELRRKAIENRAKNLRSYLLMCMQRANVHKIETPEMRLSVRKNPPALVIDDPKLIPAKYWRIPDPPPPEVDKAAIKQAIRDGHPIEGAHLEHSEDSERIQID
jgi:hypothetical protein